MSAPRPLTLILLFVLASWRLATGQPLPTDPQLVTGRLDNGLTYLLYPNQEPEDQIEFRLVVRAGSLQETSDQLGLAHFVEHMAFNGTRHFEKNELINLLELSGARFGPDINAYTSFDQTVYMLQLPADRAGMLDTALLILDDWARGLAFSPEEIEKERGVILSEWRSRLSPDQRLEKRYFPLKYQASRFLERLPIGDPEIIQYADPSAIEAFYRRWYRPELMAIVAVGEFHPDSLAHKIRLRFSDWESTGVPAAPGTYTTPDHFGVRTGIFTDPEAPFTRIQFFIKQPPFKVRTQADLRQQLAHILVNRMLGSRLFELVQRPDPPFTFANSSYGPDLGDRGVYFISAFTRETGVLRGLRAVYTATLRAAQQGFTLKELERQKQELLTQAEHEYRERSNVPSSRLASNLIYRFLDTLPFLAPQQNLQLYQELLPTISLETVNALLPEWLHPDNRTIVLTGPESQKDQLPEATGILALIDSLEKADYLPYEDPGSEKPLLPTPPPSPGKVAARHQRPYQVTELELSNGIRVVLKPTDLRQDEVLLTAFSDGGHSLYPDSVYQAAALAASIIDMGGVGDLSATDLQRTLSGKDVSLSPFISEFQEGFNGSCAPDQLETLLQLTYLYATRPRYDTVALASYIKRQEAVLANMMTNPYYFFADLSNRIRYQNHPRRQLTQLKDLAGIRYQTIYDIFQDRFADMRDFTFILVGNLDTATAIPLIETYLGALPAGQRSETYRDTGADLIEGRYDTLIIRGQAPKALAQLTFHGPFAFESAQRYALTSMVSVLRLRLREKLREDMGGVYSVGVTGSYFSRPRPTFRIRINFYAAPEDVQPLVETVHQEILRLQESGATEQELQKIREAQLQSRRENMKTNSYWLSQLSFRYREKEPLENMDLESLERTAAALTNDDILTAAKHYLSGEHYIELILLPENK